jgi:hypothetical protein
LTIRRERIRARAARSVLTALICVDLIALTVSSGDLFIRQSAGEIHVTAPHAHFLTGRALERLHDGAVAAFDLQFSVAAGSKTNVVARAVERFIVSYDVWQERFSVVRLRDFRKSGAKASAIAAESWCVDNMALPASLLPSNQELWAKLEIRGVDQKDQASAWAGAGISVTTLIEIFSRPTRPQQEHWSLETAAFHLSDLQPADLKPADLKPAELKP